MKPRIKKVRQGQFQGLWSCTGSGAVGIGGSMQVAWKHWKTNADFAKRLDLIASK